jgi:flagellar motor switch protein FliN
MSNANEQFKKIFVDNWTSVYNTILGKDVTLTVNSVQVKTKKDVAQLIRGLQSFISIRYGELPGEIINLGMRNKLISIIGNLMVGLESFKDDITPSDKEAFLEAVNQKFSACRAAIKENFDVDFNFRDTAFIETGDPLQLIGGDNVQLWIITMTLSGIGAEKFVMIMPENFAEVLHEDEEDRIGKIIMDQIDFSSFESPSPEPPASSAAPPSPSTPLPPPPSSFFSTSPTSQTPQSPQFSPASPSFTVPPPKATPVPTAPKNPTFAASQAPPGSPASQTFTAPSGKPFTASRNPNVSKPPAPTPSTASTPPPANRPRTGVGNENSNIDLLMDVEIPITVRIGTTEMTFIDIMRLGLGSVIELEKMVDDPVEVLANGKLVAKGEIVTCDGNYAVKITEVQSKEARIKSLV